MTIFIFFTHTRVTLCICLLAPLANLLCPYTTTFPCWCRIEFQDSQCMKTVFVVSIRNTGTGTMPKWPAHVGTVVANVGIELSLLKMAISMTNADYLAFFLWTELEPHSQQQVAGSRSYVIIFAWNHNVATIAHVTSEWDTHWTNLTH